MSLVQSTARLMCCEICERNPTCGVGCGSCASALEPSTWPLRCSCGESYGPRGWSLLPLVGYQDDGAGGRLELRNCERCSSTMAVEVPRFGLSDHLRDELAYVMLTEASSVDARDAAEAERLRTIADELSSTYAPSTTEAA